LLVILSLGLTAGCKKGPSQTARAAPRIARQAHPQSLQVLVPCGQLGPFYEIKPLFEKANPAVKIDGTVENITVITRKVMDGLESPEVFMSMGDREVSLLEAKGRVVPGTRAAYARNSIALIVSSDNPAKVKTLRDLTRAKVKTFAVVDPETSSAGYHTREALEKLGLWKQILKKTITFDQPAQVAETVGRGQAQAGIAYWPCMVETKTPGAEPTPKKKVVVAEPFPQKLYTPFHCEAVVVKGAKNPEMGRKFIAFLQDPQVQQIFYRWNFFDPENPPKTAPSCTPEAK